MVQIQAINKILRTSDISFVISNELTTDYFYDYPDEFDFIMEHYKKYGNVPDVETFIDKFNEFSVLEVTESDKYLVDKLREEYLYKKLVPILTQGASILKDGDSRDAQDYVISSIKDIEVSHAEIGESIIRCCDKRYNEYLERKNSTTPWMRPTGFKELDDEIGGLCPGEEFVVIVARTNNGKSWFLAKMLTHNWKVGANVGYISPEMSASQVGYRFDTLNKHFSNFSLYTGKELDDDYDGYIDDLKQSTKNDFIVATPLDFDKKITIQKLKNFILKYKLDILGIDGITYLTDERYKRGDNKTTSLTNISEDLMSLSCELKIPIIAVVQANRNGVDENGDVPALESIRDSDGISHNASKVISIRQQDGKLKMEVTKARNCKVGAKLTYSWKIDTGIFEFIEEDDCRAESKLDQPSSSFSPRQHKPVENKQPIVARRGSSSNPF